MGVKVNQKDRLAKVAHDAALKHALSLGLSEKEAEKIAQDLSDRTRLNELPNNIGTASPVDQNTWIAKQVRDKVQASVDANKPKDDSGKPATPMSDDDKKLRKEQQQFGWSSEVVDKSLKELGLKSAKDYLAGRPEAEAANQTARKKMIEENTPKYDGPMPPPPGPELFQGMKALPDKPPDTPLNIPPDPMAPLVNAANQNMMMQAAQGGKPPSVQGPLAEALAAMAGHGVGGFSPPRGMPGGMLGMKPPMPRPPMGPPPATLDNGRPLSQLTPEEHTQLEDTAQNGGSKDFIAQLRRMRGQGTGIVGGVASPGDEGGNEPDPGAVPDGGAPFKPPDFGMGGAESPPGLADMAKQPGGLYLGLQPGDQAPQMPGAQPPNLMDMMRKAMQAAQGPPIIQ